MIFNSELLFFFSALGAFNGLLLSFYFLFFVKPKHISNRFLGAFLLMLSLRVGKSVAFYFNQDLSFVYLQFGLSACFFIGPFLYFYIKSVIQPQSNIHKTWTNHLLILFPTILVVGYIFPFNNYVDLWRPYFIYTIYIQWLMYTIMSGLLLIKHFNKIYVDKKLKSIGIWLLTIYIGNIIILFAYLFTSYTYYIVGALSFSFLFYLLILIIVFSKKKKPYLFLDAQKYMDKKINDTDANTLTSQLKILLSDKKLHKNPDLKISDVANQLNISAHQLSQLLNDNIGKNFPSIINEYRILEAKEMLIQNEKYTLEAIGYECGFKSKSAFYTAFKKHVGATPAKYLDSKKSTTL